MGDGPTRCAGAATRHSLFTSAIMPGSMCTEHRTAGAQNPQLGILSHPPGKLQRWALMSTKPGSRWKWQRVAKPPGRPHLGYFVHPPGESQRGGIFRSMPSALWRQHMEAGLP